MRMRGAMRAGAGATAVAEAPEVRVFWWFWSFFVCLFCYFAVVVLVLRFW